MRNIDVELQLGIHTVDGDGDGLSEDEAIGTNEGGDLAQRVELGVLSALVERGVHIALSRDHLDVQVIALGRDQDRDGARVVLKTKVSVITTRLRAG